MCDIQHKIHHFHFDLWQSEILYAFRDRWLIIYILIFFMRSFTVGFRKLTLNHQLCITQKSLWDNGGKHKHVITAKYTRTVLLWCREQAERNLLMAAVPLPGIAWPAWQEVRRALVLDTLWEAQQHPRIVISRPVRRAAQHKQDTKHSTSDISRGPQRVQMTFGNCVLTEWLQETTYWE